GVDVVALARHAVIRLVVEVHPQIIGGAAVIDQVEALAAAELVRGRDGEGIRVEEIVARIAEELIGILVARELVAPGPSVFDVLALVPLDVVVPRLTKGLVIATAQEHGVVERPGRHEIVALTGVDALDVTRHVVALARPAVVSGVVRRERDVGVAAEVERIEEAGPAAEDVRPISGRPGAQPVAVAGSAVGDVVAVTGLEVVALTVAFERVVAIVA